MAPALSGPGRPPSAPLRLLVVCAALFWASNPARAVDGVLEINQACAVLTGCFTGDTPGLPVTVDGSSGRSLRLTSDLQVPDSNTTAIQVRADDISLDLNGFSIRGATRCTSDPVSYFMSCSPFGSGRGVTVDPSLSPRPSGLEVRNGSVVGMGNHGVVLGARGRALDLRVSHNGGDGIQALGPGATVGDCNVESNGQDGIMVDAYSLVAGSAVHQNGSRGIASGDGSTISRNTSAKNQGIGIEADDGSVVTGNASDGNALSGIVAGYGSVVSQNTVHLNGHKGIVASAGSRVSGNAAYKNKGTGLFLDARAAYDNNSVVGNTTDQVLGGVNRGGNFCDGPGTGVADCP